MCSVLSEHNGEKSVEHAKERHRVGPNGKNPPKLRFKESGKLIVSTYTCNSLTSFESEADAINENKNYANLLKLNCKNS